MSRALRACLRCVDYVRSLMVHIVMQVLCMCTYAHAAPHAHNYNVQLISLRKTKPTRQSIYHRGDSPTQC